MANRLTVFYSWQSDTPSYVNRNFIEKALKEALKRLQSDAELDSPLRDSVVELDKDTKGVAGSPPIAQTILAKIEQCAVFVADLTFVGESKPEIHPSTEKPRLFPNPNVLIEYGYALRCHTHTKIIGVVNAAFGEPNSETLPFDLRHLRWPITYHLSEKSAPDKTDQFEKLTVTLVDALRAILSQHLEKEEPTALFVPRKSTANPAVFYRDMDELIPEAGMKTDKNTYCVPEGAKAYLRLYPTKSVPQLKHQLEAKEKANQGMLRPLGEVEGSNTRRNALGAIVYEERSDGKLYHFTQLFLSREIWGIDASILNEARQSDLQKRIPNANIVKSIATDYIQRQFVRTLENYLTFAKLHLLLQPPISIEAGLVGIKGYWISQGSPDRFYSLNNELIWHDEIKEDKPAWDILGPFFDSLWAECDLHRTAEQQAQMAKDFEQRR